MAGGRDALGDWSTATAASAESWSAFLSNTERATAWMDAMHDLKGTYGSVTVASRYERLRERYVTDEIDLEEFAAGVTSLLMEGL